MTGDELVTTRDVYQELRTVHQKVDVISVHIEKLPDHEKRIRSLERWRYAIPVSLLIAVLSFLDHLTAHR